MIAEALPEADEAYEALLQFLYLAPVGLAQITPDGEVVMINPLSAQLLLPLAPDGGLTNLFTALEGVAPGLRHLVEAFEPASGMVCEAMHLQIDAGVRGGRDARMLSLTLLKLDAQRLMAVLSDVTQQVKRERLLRQNEAWFNAIVTGITDYALVSLDIHGCIDDWNAGIGRVTGFTREQVLGRPYAIFFPPDATTPERVADRLREADDTGWSLDEGWRQRADGTRFWGSALISPLHDRADLLAAGTPSAPAGAGADLPGYCLVLRDISDKRAAGESLRQATSCDHLTGIANRRAFFEAAEVELARWRRSPRDLALIMIDADHFKAINDRHGHPAGDAVLRDLAAVLGATFREVDVVARVGGEEFAVLLPSTDLRGAMAVANRLIASVAGRQVQTDAGPIAYTVSGGVATMDDGIAGLDALMKRADLALYAAKAAGRNRVERWAPA